jgi:hypothetical protein
MEKKEEFNEDYIYVHWAGNQKKADTKVIEHKKLLSNAEIENQIRNRLKAKEPFFRIKSDLQNQSVSDTKIDETFIQIVKVK